MFIDASALCAVLLGEGDADLYDAKVGAASEPITSSLAAFETVLAIARETDGDIVRARRDVEEYLTASRVAIVPIGPPELARALDAFDRYGKGRHPARLNMGDCFAYACARTQGVPLLYKGDDFARTDIPAG